MKKNFKIKKSLIVSNIFDPYTKDINDLRKIYKYIFEKNNYDSIETRVIEKEMVSFFNKIRNKDITITYYLTGQLSRNNLSLCKTDDVERKKAINFCKRKIDQAIKTGCNYIGVVSGKSEENLLHNLDKFVDSIKKLLSYIKKKKYNIKLAIEPLDQYADKRNCVGTLDTTLRLLRKLEKDNFDEKDFILVWDSAHFALNEEDFETSIKMLSRYIYKVHFANAVLDYKQKDYGDKHLDFSKGFMNEKVAKNILEYCSKYIDHEIELSCEIRTNNKSDCFKVEKYCLNFIDKVIKKL